MALLSVTNLRKSFDGFLAVEDVSFSLDAGEVFGLLGPNGAGKSTTMSMIAGLLRPDAGSVTLDGGTMGASALELKRQMGLVPQDLAVYPNLTARENLALFGKLYGLYGAALKERVADVLERTGLSDRADDHVETYSGGMKRRLNFGVALLHEPRLLILDEPTVGVDPQSRAHLLECVRQASADGVATIYASHYMEEVQSVCDHVAIIDHGNVVACDTLERLLERMESELLLHVHGGAGRIAEALGTAATVRGGADDTQVIVVSGPEADGGDGLTDRLSCVLDALRSENVVLSRIETHEPNLERLFLELTGHRLRD